MLAAALALISLFGCYGAEPERTAPNDTPMRFRLDGVAESCHQSKRAKELLAENHSRRFALSLVLIFGAADSHAPPLVCGD
ncbi:MAG: hypothetical protein EOO73_11820 [Myxococcales bacterium]|nr:MAG: hypothetical protein EOO73_11820 [Myxococcales bacterium]